MIVECVGLPGAGKTTICNAVTIPHGGKGAVALTALRPHRRLLRAAWHIMRLCATARPFSFKRLIRGCNLVVFLRHYETSGLNILLDQGTVQKIWSILADTTSYSRARLGRLMTSLKPFTPDSLVWIEIPADIALDRMVKRKFGKSRYDGLPAGVAAAQLAARAGLLAELTKAYQLSTGVALVTFDGQELPSVNGARIEALLSSRA